MAKRKKRSPRGIVDWKKAQKFYEQDGKNFSEIGRLLSCDRRTVSAHARTGCWIDPTDIAQDTANARRERIVRKFVERDGAAILENLERKHYATTLLLDFFVETAEQLTRKENDKFENPVLAAGQAALGLRRLQIVDDLLADLKDGSWRADTGIRGAGADPHEEALQSALQALGDD